MIKAGQFTGSLFFLICIAIVFLHVQKTKKVSLLDWSILGMGGIYGFGWVLVLDVTTQDGNPLWADLLLSSTEHFLYHAIATQILLLGVLAGWFFCTGVSDILKPKLSSTQIFSPRKWSLVFWMLLFFSVASQFLYTHAYGGPIGLFQYAVQIRSGAFESVPANSLSFLKPFGGFSIIASLGFFGLAVSERRTILDKFGFSIALSFSTFVLISWLGRLGLFAFLLTFPVAYATLKIKQVERLLVIYACGLVVLLATIYYISSTLEFKSADSLHVFFVREISFPFVGFFSQISSGKYLNQGFTEILFSPLYLLPSSIWSLYIESSGQINTSVISGASKGTAGQTSTIPVDLLTLGVMQLKLTGVALTGFLFGVMLNLVSKVVNSIQTRGIRIAFECNLALSVAIIGVFYAQPNLFITNLFHWIVFGFAVAAFRVLYLISGNSLVKKADFGNS